MREEDKVAANKKEPEGKAPVSDAKPVGPLEKRFAQPGEEMTGGMRAALDRLGAA